MPVLRRRDQERSCARRHQRRLASTGRSASTTKRNRAPQQRRSQHVSGIEVDTAIVAAGREAGLVARLLRRRSRCRAPRRTARKRCCPASGRARSRRRKSQAARRTTAAMRLVSQDGDRNKAQEHDVAERIGAKASGECAQPRTGAAQKLLAKRTAGDQEDDGRADSRADHCRKSADEGPEQEAAEHRQQAGRSAAQRRRRRIKSHEDEYRDDAMCGDECRRSLRGAAPAFRSTGRDASPWHRPRT